MAKAAFGLALLIVLPLLTGLVYEQVGRWRDASRMPPRIGRAVDVGGRTMNISCVGAGSPAVILETGGNAPGLEWEPLQRKMAVSTRNCWYDRAGVGWSDPPSSPRTAASIATDLHALLAGAGVPPPYVMVGASVGGEYVRIYTARYPGDVAGMVLVDSAHPDQPEPEFMRAPSAAWSPGRRHLICAMLPAMSRFGVLRVMAGGGPAANETLATLESQPKALRADMEQACLATDSGRINPAVGGGNPDVDQAARNAGSLGDRPLIVLTAGRYWAPDGFEKVAAEYHDLQVNKLQAGLARLSTRGRQIIVDAGHDIGGDAPDALVGAVRQVVEEVRAK